MREKNHAFSARCITAVEVGYGPVSTAAFVCHGGAVRAYRAESVSTILWTFAGVGVVIAPGRCRAWAVVIDPEGPGTTVAAATRLVSTGPAPKPSGVSWAASRHISASVWTPSLRAVDSAGGFGSNAGVEGGALSSRRDVPHGESRCPPLLYPRAVDI